MPGLVPRRIGRDKSRMGGRITTRWRDWPGMVARAVLALVLPPRCPGCGGTVSDTGRFCRACWGDLDFIGPPWCAACNVPFDGDRGDQATCAACLRQPPLHAGIRAAVAYGPVARRVALRLKYGGRTAYAGVAAALMLRHLPADADLLVPVPLHRWRAWRRGYNQAGLLAMALARRSGTRCEVAALHRWRPTVPLKGLGRRERRRVLAGVIRARPGAAIAGRHVVLVDDVVASGATVDACTAALLKAGAARVTVLAWARVVERQD